MPNWNQHDVHRGMHVYSLDNQDLGQIENIYEDSFHIHKGIIFPDNRYIPYSAIAKIEGDRVELVMNADEAKTQEWQKRPDYEDHIGDPLQLFYDRGHGVHDPFDEMNPNKPGE